MEMFCTFLGESEFNKHVQQFHRALNEHYREGGKHLYDPAEMETFSNKHAPGLFAQLYKSILNDDKEKPSKKHGNAEDKSCVIVTQSQLHGNQVYVLILRGLLTTNTNAFPDFNLSSDHWKFIFYIVTRTAPFASYLDSERHTLLLKGLSQHIFD